MVLEGDSTPDNTTDIVVHVGLPEPVHSVDEQSSLESNFSNIYTILERAIAEQSPEAYADGVRLLIGQMRAEINNDYQKSSGDMGNTMIEWANKLPNLDQEALERLKKGNNIVRRSNTLNNSRAPHGTGNFIGDQTDRNNSRNFGTTVVNYVNRRGKDYVTVQLVDGQPVQMEPVSIFQVETTLKGYPSRVQRED